MKNKTAPDFISDEEMSKMEQGSPDFISDEEMSKLEASQPKLPSPASSFGRQSVHGVTAGFSDELSGYAGSGMDWLSELMTGSSPTSVNRKLKEQGFKGDFGPTNRDELYEQIRNEERAKNKLDEETNPTASLGGNVVGGVASSIVPGGLIAKAGLTGKAALGAAGALGLTEGGLAAVGTSEKEGLESLEDAPVGMALGGGFGVAGAAAPSILKYLGKKGIELADTGLRTTRPGVELADMFQTAYKSGKNLVTPFAQESVGDEKFYQIEKLAKDLFSEESDIGLPKAAKEKVLTYLDELDAGIVGDASEVPVIWNNFKKTIDTKGASIATKNKIAELDARIGQLTQETVITPTQTTKINKNIIEKTPSTESELLKNAELQAAMRNQAGESVSPQMLKVNTPEGEYGQAALLRRVSPLSKPIIDENEEVIGEKLLNRLSDNEKFERLGSPKLLQPEIPKRTIFSPERTVEDISSVVPLDPSKTNLRLLETMRRDFGEMTDKEIAHLQNPIKNIRNALSKSINLASPNKLGPANKKVENLLALSRAAGIDSSDEEILKMMELGTLTDALLKKGFDKSIGKARWNNILQLAEEVHPRVKSTLEEVANLSKQEELTNLANKEGLSGFSFLGPARTAPIKASGLLGQGLNKASKLVPVQAIKRLSESGIEYKASPTLYSNQRLINAPDTEAADVSKANEPVNTTKRLYNQSNDELVQSSQILRQDPSLKNLADALEKAIQDKDPRKKDSILFTLSQNPKARKLLHIGE